MRRLVLALVALGLVAPTLPAAGLPPGGMYGDELRVALPTQPSLDPIQFAANRVVQEVAYDSLTRLGPNQLPVPWLASALPTIPAPGTITLDLRAATWPDGSPITAQDVAWSYGKHLTGGSASGFTVTAVDADTVRFTFTTGGGDFLGNAATLPVAWKSGSDTRTSNGPFVLAAQSATATDLAANDRHWKGRPYLDRVSIRHPFTLARSPSGATTADDAACALMKGQVHLIGWPVTTADLTTERDCVAGFGGWTDGVNRTLLDVDRRVPFLGLSEDAGLRFLYLGMNTQRPPLTQPVLRQALSRAVDRDLIAGAIEPKTDIADSVVTEKNEAWANESVPRYRVPRVTSGTAATTSLEAVNAFLDEAGYLDTDLDGYRQDPSGAPFSFTLLTVDQQADTRVAKYLDLITKFQAIGMNVTQREMTPANLTVAVASGAFDLYVDVLEVGGEPSFLFDLFHSSGSRNLVRLASPDMDAILETARDAIDPNVRRRAVLDAQGWVGVNVPLAPVVHRRAVYALDRLTFEGWSHGLGGIANFWSFVSVHATQRGPLVVRVDAVQATLRSGGQTTVLVRVLDGAGDPVADVDLEFVGEGLSAATGVTDAQGESEVEFTAPAVAAPTEYPITVNAAKPGYDGASGDEAVVVNPAIRTFDISLERGETQMPSGNSTSILVVVIDETLRVPAEGVTVSLAVDPADGGGELGQATGVTDAQGEFETTFTASVAVASRFFIVVTVAEPGYVEARATTTFEVAARGGGVPVTPALDTISMVVVVAGLAAIFGAWQRRQWLVRKP